ncbi:thioredoxin family protein [Clostridium saccharobutylicum]|uniref:thioredoxin family protein n=1 Tax=Clostridium saccharobutylicum TaxID=169679 RepID=UPI0007E0EB63|nr:thioredoxin domain-containing protein [Clostridium saccharobutylicum]OAV38760.1 thioredoxin [Clostridium saccharobutylicum DSM 13864]
MITNINDENFQKEVLEEEKLVLVDFSAWWCGPCKMVAPILERISNENCNIKITTIDVDRSPVASIRYQVQSIPAIKFFKNGEVVHTSGLHENCSFHVKLFFHFFYFIN